MYKSFLTNSKNVLFDFIKEICFGEKKEHRWNLVYPELTGIKDTTSLPEDLSEEDFNKQMKIYNEEIINKRHATISTSFIPELEWIKEPEHFTTKDIALIDNKYFSYTLKNKIYDNSPVELILNNGRKFQLYQSKVKNKEELNLLEFYVDYDNNEIIVNLDDEISKDLKFSLRYKIKGQKLEEWFVSLHYPKYTSDYYIIGKTNEENDFVAVINSAVAHNCTYENGIKYVIVDENFEVGLTFERHNNQNDTNMSFQSTGEIQKDYNYSLAC